VNVQIVKPWLVACGLTLGVVLVPTAYVNAQGIVSNDAANGSVELSNISATDSPEPAAVEPSAATAAATPTAESATAEAPKDPREQYRDQVLKEPEGPTSATSAVSRRYKKMDKATYQATMLDAAAQTAPAK
jgi:hypothetical protein